VGAGHFEFHLQVRKELGLLLLPSISVLFSLFSLISIFFPHENSGDIFLGRPGIALKKLYLKGLATFPPLLPFKSASPLSNQTTLRHFPRRTKVAVRLLPRYPDLFNRAVAWKPPLPWLFTVVGLPGIISYFFFPGV